MRGIFLPCTIFSLMRKSPQRTFDVAVMVAVCAVAGLLLGYVWGRTIVLRNARQRLDAFAERIRTEGETSAEEARAVLDELNHSPYSPCSHQEDEFFRTLMYQSQFLKDAGRMQDGRIQCSALLGPVSAASDAGYGEGFHRPDGTRVYRDLPPYLVPGVTSVAVQMGRAFVVYNPFRLRPFEAPPMHFSIADRDAQTGSARFLLGDAAKAKAGKRIFTQDGTATIGNTLYATRCTARYSSCITAYISVHDALHSDPGQLKMYVGLSGLCGALFGFGIAMAYRRNRSMERQLRRAIRRNEIGVVYQPIYDLQTGCPIAAEALARWTDESGSPVAPDVFIPLAEHRGFIREITRCMVHQALSAWRQIARVAPAFCINVNITAADLHDPSFAPMVAEALASTGAPPRALAFEITESSWARWQSAEAVLAGLRAAGHLVEIDDFGTGYSSLAYLNHLPIDVLKIDKEFTQSIGTQSMKISLVPQILSLAAALNLRVVVEGVETDEQVRYFAGCKPSVVAQGWYFGKPMPLEELADLLRKNQAISIPRIEEPSAADARYDI